MSVIRTYTYTQKLSLYSRQDVAVLDAASALDVELVALADAMGKPQARHTIDVLKQLGRLRPVSCSRSEYVLGRVGSPVELIIALPPNLVGRVLILDVNWLKAADLPEPYH